MILSAKRVLALIIVIFLFSCSVESVWAKCKPLKALLVTGQNNHPWRESANILVKILQQTELFDTYIAISPDEGGDFDIEDFRPEFKDYDVVVLNYVGERWSGKTDEAFVEYVKNGGGVVAIHSAGNAFSDWKEYNEMLGLGGWGGRDERWGPYVYWQDGKVVRDKSPGEAGVHPMKHCFLITVRDKEHPITRGMPERWLHARDGMNIKMRGPAKNLTVLATAYADAAFDEASGRHEPMLITVRYGKGRVFHTYMGHAGSPPITSMQCVGFITSIQRGAEWAATGKVTQAIPQDFPTATQVSKWCDFEPPKCNVDSDGPVVQFRNISSSGMECGNPAGIEVVLSEASDEVVSVDYGVIELTKDEYEDDYELSDGSLRFEKGQRSKEILLEIVDDEDYEPVEVITLELLNPVNAVPGGKRQHSYTINDDEDVKEKGNNR